MEFHEGGKGDSLENRLWQYVILDNWEGALVSSHDAVEGPWNPPVSREHCLSTVHCRHQLWSVVVRGRGILHSSLCWSSQVTLKLGFSKKLKFIILETIVKNSIFFPPRSASSVTCRLHTWLYHEIHYHYPDLLLSQRWLGDVHWLPGSHSRGAQKWRRILCLQAFAIKIGLSCETDLLLSRIGSNPIWMSPRCTCLRINPIGTIEELRE